MVDKNQELDATQTIEKEINTSDLVLFMKGTPAFPMCGFSATVVQILNNLEVKSNKLHIYFIEP